MLEKKYARFEIDCTKVFSVDHFQTSCSWKSFVILAQAAGNGRRGLAEGRAGRKCSTQNTNSTPGFCPHKWNLSLILLQQPHCQMPSSLSITLLLLLHKCQPNWTLTLLLSFYETNHSINYTNNVLFMCSRYKKEEETITKLHQTK